MKRKRPDRHDQSLKEQENSSSSKLFRSNITGKLQTLLSGFVSELQSISEDKRQDVALIFNPQYKKINVDENSSTVKSAFPSLENSSDSTEVLQNFIDSAKSRISGLLNNKQVNQISGGNNLLNFKPSLQPKTKSLSIDPLEIQINLKFQSLLFKAFDTKKTNHVTEKQEITTSEIITEKDWQDLSRMLQDFSESARRKLHTSLTRERNIQFLNNSGNVQNSHVKENRSSKNIQPSLVSQRISQNIELPDSSLNQEITCSMKSGSRKPNKKNAKLLRMDFSSESTDDSSSPRNPFDEGCMLLLSDAEKCPKYVDLQLSSESDLDEPDDIELSNSHVLKFESESDDEVIVLGEKSKTYQEVTLEEDDDGQVHESVVEKVLEKCPKKEKDTEELVFNCSKCDKSFRVQSLLQFHIKMHAAENPASHASEYQCSNSTSSSEDKSSSPERSSNLNQRVKKEKENTKISSKISIKKSHHEKFKKRRNKETSKYSL